MKSSVQRIFLPTSEKANIKFKRSLYYEIRLRRSLAIFVIGHDYGLPPKFMDLFRSLKVNVIWR